MGKDKKKGSKKNKPSQTLLETAAYSLKRFRHFGKQFGKLSTTQKLVGGVALLAAGYAYLTHKSEAVNLPDQTDALTNEPRTQQPAEPGAGISSGATKKYRRASKHTGHHPPFSVEAP